MGINIRGVIKGSLLSIAITLIILFVLALIAYFTHTGENTITVCAYGAVIVGALIGSVLVSLSAPSQKFVHVMLMCAVYTAVLIALSFILNGEIVFNLHMAAVIGGIFAASFLGLILGGKK